MTIESVAIQLAHIVHQIRVVVEDVAKESVNERSWVLDPLQKETSSDLRMGMYLQASRLSHERTEQQSDEQLQEQ